MKTSLRRPALYAAGAVAVSLFLLLCMVPYGRAEYLAPEAMLEQRDAFRYRLASLLVRPFGAGAFLGMSVVLCWSVIAYFKESVGAVLPRVVGLATVVPSFCAMTSLGSEPHEFWAGSVGIWAGNLIYGGFGPVMGWAIVGTLFAVSLAMATELGFHRYFADLRGVLSVPLLGADQGGPATALLDEEPDAPPAPRGPLAGLDVSRTATGAAAPFLPSPAGADDDVMEVAPDALSGIRARVASGSPVTDAELDLLDGASDRDAADGPPVAPADPAEADAFFTSWGVEGVPAERAEEALEADAVSDDTPGELELAPPPAGPQAVVVRSPDLVPESHARMISLDEIRVAITDTEELPEEDAAPSPPLPAHRPSPLFAAVEFMDPSEELADWPASAPVSAGIPAADFAPAPSRSGDGDVPPPVLSLAPAPAADAAPPADVVAPGAFEFEDEFFAYAPAPEEPVEAEASPAFVEPQSAVEIPPPAEEPAGSADEDGAWLAGPSWLDEGAAPAPAAEPEAPAPGEPVDEVVLDGEPEDVELPGDETADEMPSLEAAREVAAVAAPENVPEPAAPVEVDEFLPDAPVEVEDEVVTADEEGTLAEASAAVGTPEPPPAREDTQDVLLRLFGEPVTRGPDGSPGGFNLPVEAAPFAAEPPALELAPPAPEGDAALAEEHAAPADVHLEDEVFDEPVTVVETGEAPADEASAEPEVEAEAADAAETAVEIREPLTAETAADSVVRCLRDLFGDPLPEEPAAGNAAEEAAPTDGTEAAGTSDAGPLLPFPGAEAEAEEPAPRPRRRRTRKPAAAPAREPEPPTADLPLRVVDRVAMPPVDAEDAVPVDADRVDRIVGRFREDPVPAAAPAPTPVEIPAPDPVAAAEGAADPMYPDAVSAVRERGRGSVIVLQRRLGIGFTRATRLLAELVSRGVLGPENGSGSHPIL